MNLSFSHRKGFTLIELLVVIAIIGILASILFPVFARARENARRSSCASNLKQIGLGMIQYSQDFDETIVAYGYGVGNNVYQPSDPALGRYKWMDAIYPYIKSAQVFDCPSMSVANRKYKYAGPGASDVIVGEYGSYQVNTAYRNAPNDALTPPISSYENSNIRTMKLSSIQAPATTAWVVENAVGTRATNGAVWGGGGYPYMFLTGSVADTVVRHPGRSDDLIPVCAMGNTSADYSGGTALTGIAPRHLETTNILYTDGHVKAVSIDALLRTGTGGVVSAFTIEDD